MTTDAERLSDEREKLAWDEYVREHGYSTCPVEPDTGADFSAGFRAGLASVAAERDAEVRQALVAAGLAENCSVADLIRHHRGNASAALGFDVVRAEAERDALRARIEAAEAVFADAEVLDETAISMHAALAGDQPEVKNGDADPSVIHPYQGNRSGLTCWRGHNHALGMCRRDVDHPIHQPEARKTDDEDHIAETTMTFAEEVVTGRIKAHQKHGENSIEAVPGSDIARWLPILGEEFGEVCEALTYDKDSSNLRAELVDLVTVGVAWITALDRETGDQPEAEESDLPNGHAPVEELPPFLHRRIQPEAVQS